MSYIKRGLTKTGIYPFNPEAVDKEKLVPSDVQDTQTGKSSSGCKETLIQENPLDATQTQKPSHTTLAHKNFSHTTPTQENRSYATPSQEQPSHTTPTQENPSNTSQTTVYLYVFVQKQIVSVSHVVSLLLCSAVQVMYPRNQHHLKLYTLF